MYCQPACLQAPSDRPVTEPEVQTLLGFYKAGRAEGGFDAGTILGVDARQDPVQLRVGGTDPTG